MDESSKSQAGQHEVSSDKEHTSPGLSTSSRRVVVWWPAATAVLLTLWAAARATEGHKWLDVAAMCGPQTILYAVLENVLQRRAPSRGRRMLLLLTSPLVLLAASIAWWFTLLLLTRGSALLAVLEMGFCFAIVQVAVGYAVLVGLLGYTRLIDRRPWIGAVIGVVGLGLVGAWCASLALEYGHFLTQTGPVPLDCHDVTSAGVTTRQWVRVAEGFIPGIIRPQARRTFPLSVLLGKVDHTDVALVDSGSEKWIDLRFDGLNNGPSYWGPSKESYEGILAAPNNRLWGNDVPAELVRELHRPPVGVLHVKATPSKVRNLAIASFMCLSMIAWFTLHCVRHQLCLLALTKRERAGIAA
jgi:hypothetical protein